MSQSRRRLLAGALLLFWLLSLALPVAGTTAGSVGGLSVLLTGWLAVLMFQFGWFANILLPFGLILAARRKPGRWVEIVLGAALLLLSVNAMFWRNLPDDSGDHPITIFHSGYFCWMAAMLACGAWLILQGLRVSKTDTI